MTSKLRDRRRQQTAREIQLAALRLSLRSGYGAVTTESIAAEAGISPRTFFNYYANKQSALMGEMPELDPDCAAWIVRSDAPLVPDLAKLLGALLDAKPLDREVIRMVKQVWETTPELMTVFRNSMDRTAQAIGALLAARLGPDRETEALLIAELATHVLSQAVRTWAEDETMDRTDLAPLMERHLRTVGGLLAR